MIVDPPHCTSGRVDWRLERIKKLEARSLKWLK